MKYERPITETAVLHMTTERPRDRRHGFEYDTPCERCGSRELVRRPEIGGPAMCFECRRKWDPHNQFCEPCQRWMLKIDFPRKIVVMCPLCCTAIYIAKTNPGTTTAG